VTGVTGWGWLAVFIWVIIDLGSYGGGYGSRRRRARYA
jgi:hypothetical protein